MRAAADSRAAITIYESTSTATSSIFRAFAQSSLNTKVGSAVNFDITYRNESFLVEDTVPTKDALNHLGEKKTQ